MEILIVDDHALFREGLRHVLNKMEDGVRVLEAPDYEQAIQYVSDNPGLDLVLLDLNMPGKGGFDTLDVLTKRYPALPIVILSASSQRNDVQCALEKGALGFIHKDTSSTVMISALKMILSGGIYVPPNTVFHQRSDQNEEGAGDLTPRQLDVLKLLGEGHSNKVIAADLDLAEPTVKMHVTAIFKSLGVSNRTQAVLEAEKLGLFDA